VSRATYTQLLGLAGGVALVAAALALWRWSLVAIVRILAVQGVALAAVALLLGLHHDEAPELIVALGILVLKVGVIPAVLLRVVHDGPDQRVTEPSINTATALVAAAVLTVIAFGATRGLVDLAQTPEAQLIPVGFAIVLVAFFGLVARRNALTQLVGFLLLENGIALVALVATARVSLVVELGAALDLLLAVLVLQVFTSRMRSKFGALDLDRLTELSD
jgi:hydrogenase-4 component E